MSDDTTSSQLTLFAEDSPASPIALQENGKAKTTSATSGQSISESSENSGPLGYLERMFLEYARQSSTTSSMILRVWATPRGRSIYRLAPSARRTSDTGSSLWPTATAVTRPMEANVRMYRAKIAAGEMTEQEANAILGKSVWEAQGKVPALWPTPRSNDSSESVETLTARGERNYGRNKNGINLTAAIIDAASPEPTRLWPTPTVQDAKNNGGPSQWKRNSDPLNVAVQRWPTPRVSMANGPSQAEIDAGNPRGRLETAVAISEMLPTPTGDDANNATRQSGAYQSLTRAVGKLNPTWVEWLMGFPLGWTDLDVSETP